MSEVANAEVGGAGREEMVEDRQPDRSKDREPIEMLDVFMVARSGERNNLPWAAR